MDKLGIGGTGPGFTYLAAPQIIATTSWLRAPKMVLAITPASQTQAITDYQNVAGHLFCLKATLRVACKAIAM
jgi:hypothetical protein